MDIGVSEARLEEIILELRTSSNLDQGPDFEQIKKPKTDLFY
jgi:hypothetical protein